MLQEFISEHFVDADGNPAGGYADAVGIHIAWQEGPLNVGGERLEPNGAFVETVIATVISRLEFYQDSKFKCEPNEVALGYLESALKVLQERTRDREARAVEGTHQV